MLGSPGSGAYHAAADCGSPRRNSPISTDPSNLDTSDAASVSPAAVPFQLVAIDVDGTLLRSDRRISRATAETIEDATRRGVRVVLASARPPRSLRPIHDQLGLDNLQINYNGALIHDLKRRRHLFHQPLPAALARRVIKVARRVDPKVLVSIEILDKWYTDNFDDSLSTETSRSFAPDFIGPLESFLHVPVTKLMLLAPPHRLEPVRETVVDRFPGQIAMTISDAHLLQIIHPDVDKAAALARVAEHYGVPQQRVFSIGDAPNDIGMLRWAGLGASLENGWPAVREAADVVVQSNDKDGVAEALRRFVLV